MNSNRVLQSAFSEPIVQGSFLTFGEADRSFREKGSSRSLEVENTEGNLLDEERLNFAQH